MARRATGRVFRWSVEWFEKHREYVAKAIAPLYAASCSDLHPSAFAESYCSASVQEFASGDPSEILTVWEATKAGRLAAQLQETLQCTTES